MINILKVLNIKNINNNGIMYISKYEGELLLENNISIPILFEIEHTAIGRIYRTNLDLIESEVARQFVEIIKPMKL